MKHTTHVRTHYRRTHGKKVKVEKHTRKLTKEEEPIKNYIRLYGPKWYKLPEKRRIEIINSFKKYE